MPDKYDIARTRTDNTAEIYLNDHRFNHRFFIYNGRDEVSKPTQKLHGFLCSETSFNWKVDIFNVFDDAGVKSFKLEKTLTFPVKGLNVPTLFDAGTDGIEFAEIADSHEPDLAIFGTRQVVDESLIKKFYPNFDDHLPPEHSADMHKIDDEDKYGYILGGLLDVSVWAN